MNYYGLLYLGMILGVLSAHGMHYQSVPLIKFQQGIEKNENSFFYSDLTEVEIARREWMRSRGSAVLDTIDRLQKKRKEIYVLIVRVCQLTQNHYTPAYTDQDVKKLLEEASSMAMRSDNEERPSRNDYETYLELLRFWQDSLSILEHKMDADISIMQAIIIQNKGVCCCNLL